MELRFYDDPGEFLDVAGPHLAEQPVLSTVLAGVAARIRDHRAAGVAWPADVPCWFAAFVDGGTVVSTAMRTAPFGDHPAFLMPMTDDAAVLLARTLLDRDEPVLAANGALPAVEVFCTEMADFVGDRSVSGHRTRLFELGELVGPRPTPGGLRPARSDELTLLSSWYAAFMADADEQGGRERGESPGEAISDAELAQRIEGGRIFVWVDPHDEPVNLTAATRPTYGVSRIGPVFTPPSQRGRGYASAAVHAVSRLLQDADERVCLFTDLANPTSNKIYESIGYRPLADMANLRVEVGAP